MELRGTEADLSADLAGRQADVRGLEESMVTSRQRLEELEGDLASGNARRHEAQQNLDTCREALKKAREDVTAANNTIAGYTLRQSGRLKRRDELQQKQRELNSKQDAVAAKLRVYRAMERDFERDRKSVV